MARLLKTKTGRQKSRIFLVEDHPVFRDGLSKLLNAEKDLTVCGEAGDARQALKSIVKLKPDLMVVDLGLPGEDDPRRLGVRGWLASHPHPTGLQLAEAGYVVPHWAPPYGRDADPLTQLLIDEELRAAGVRRPGAAALDLAYVAAGRIDGFWEFGLAPWDTAAGTLLIQEAGGRVGTPTGSEYALGPNIVAGNPKVYEELLAALGPLTPGELRV